MSVSDGSFNVLEYSPETSSAPKDVSLQNGLLPPTPQWQKWYDNSICKKSGKKGHAEKYCGEPGAHDCLFHPHTCPSNSSNSGLHVSFSNNTQRMPQPEFQSPTHCHEFNHNVHNLLLEAVLRKTTNSLLIWLGMKRSHIC